MKITVELRGKGLAAFTASARDIASQRGKTAMRMALNDTGRQVTTKVKRSLAKQSGVQYGAVNKAMTQSFASNAHLEFHIKGTGKHFGLTDFKASQRKKGVSAAPWGKRRIFPHTFFVPKLGNQVFRRTGKLRFPIEKLWGPSIPREMVRDEVPVIFKTTADAVFPMQVRKQFQRLMPK